VGVKSGWKKKERERERERERELIRRGERREAPPVAFGAFPFISQEKVYT
jgi:hypothetical protein